MERTGWDEERGGVGEGEERRRVWDEGRGEGTGTECKMRVERGV